MPSIAVDSNKGKMSPPGETFPMREGARDAESRGRKGTKKVKRKEMGAVTLR